MKPPLLSSSPSPKRQIAPWAIIAICVGSAGLLLVTATVAAGVFLRTQVVEARRGKMQRVRAVEEQTTAFAQAQSEPGITYTNVKVASEPWSIHVVKIDRSRNDLTFYTAHARNKVLGVALLADQARGIPPEFGRAIAGVNGDFYDRDNPTYAGDPRGLQIIQGELISAPDTVCVWFGPDGNPHLDEVKGQLAATWRDGHKTPFGLNQRRHPGKAVLYTPTYGPSTRATGGRELVLEKDDKGPWLPLRTGQTYRARVREVSNNGNTRLTPEIMVLSFPPDLLASLPEAAPGTLLQISTDTVPDLKGAKMAIGGGPAIIKNNQPFALKASPGNVRNYSEASKYQRHPRSAIGWSKTHVYLVTADGRQPGLSVGMTLAELAKFMAELGCTEAMNLDGGKSAQMWMNGRTMNSPCQGDDTVANGVFVVRKSEPGDSQ